MNLLFGNCKELEGEKDSTEMGTHHDWAAVHDRQAAW